ncbi:MAG: 2,4-dienoyl-CoA reductase (NADPH) [bacterium ADurb.Bin236]|nr:MAG: 2,4-dienoyl-CoA reductase (NADPH) [bacterium ADurb.Bin236]HPN93301.1 FAD-dependent oxidoreductase [bacterium]
MDPLFAPIKINKLEVKNRIAMMAMQMNMISNYEVTDRICEFYAERARGGVGAICVGFVSIDRGGSAPLNIGGHDDSYIPGLTKLADAIKSNGARAMAQINHTGRQTYPMMIPKDMEPVAPSAVYCKMTGAKPRELTEEEILDIIDKFAKTAVRLKTAGFEIIEILMGTGYLVSTFLSPLTNKRTDKWGGSEENRMRFGLEVFKAVRNAVGADFPVTVRINGNDLMEDGLGSAPHIAFAKALEAAGADAICVNVGWHEARVPQITMGVPRANYAYQARRIKENVKVPVIASHRINDPLEASDLIELGYCDMVGMGRPLIADPHLPNKAMQGRDEEIIHCVACGQGCFDHVFLLQPVECMVNPDAGYEYLGERDLAEKKKKVAVVGGGPAGMSAALTAKRRGHDVTLFERAPVLGGQLYLASAPEGRREFEEIINDFDAQLDIEDVNVITDTEVTAKYLKKEKFDAVILATGAEPATIPIPGADRPNVLQAWDYLGGIVGASGKVVVLGGGAVGVESALVLAEEGTVPAETIKFLLIHNVETPEELRRLAVHGTNDVTIVEMLPRVGKDIGKSTRWTMMEDLSRYGVKVLTKAKAVEINDEGIVIDDAGTKKTLPADFVILAVGSKSYNPLEEQLKDSGIEIAVVGDAKKIGLIFDAIHAGHKAALKL